MNGSRRLAAAAVGMTGSFCFRGYRPWQLSWGARRTKVSRWLSRIQEGPIVRITMVARRRLRLPAVEAMTDA